jgi:RNA polymerase sigma factor (TIGR02999 family)
VSRRIEETLRTHVAASSGVVTRLLRAWSRGNAHAQDALLPLVYEDLRRRAAAHLRAERRDHTLQPTALVHEAYLRLLGQRDVDWQSRAHFLALASRMMRRVLVDHARTRAAAKRPAEALRVTLEGDLASVHPRGCDLLLLDQALSELSHLDERQGSIVELCYFGGLTESEVAGALSVSRSTVARELRSAKAWIYRRMTTGRPQEAT